MNTFAANQIYSIMYSSEDLERFYFQYQKFFGADCADDADLINGVYQW